MNGRGGHTTSGQTLNTKALMPVRGMRKPSVMEERHREEWHTRGRHTLGSEVASYRAPRVTPDHRKSYTLPGVR